MIGQGFKPNLFHSLFELFGINIKYQLFIILNQNMKKTAFILNLSQMIEIFPLTINKPISGEEFYNKENNLCFIEVKIKFVQSFPL